MRFLVAVVFALAMILFSTPGSAQTIVKNPSTVTFETTEFDVPGITGFELDLVTCLSPSTTDPTQSATCSGPKLVQTLVIPKSAVTPINGSSPQAYRAAINVQPVGFGGYVGDLRIVAGTIKSANATSNYWERSPGPPSRPRMN